MSRVSGLAERVRLMILRGELPPGARVVEVELAAARARAGEIDPEALRELDRLAAAPTAVADRHFHRAVGALSDNRPCRDALERAWDRIALATLDARHDPRDHEHRELLAAIAGGDAATAAQVARRHVLT